MRRFHFHLQDVKREMRISIRRYLDIYALVIIDTYVSVVIVFLKGPGKRDDRARLIVMIARVTGSLGSLHAYRSHSSQV